MLHNLVISFRQINRDAFFSVLKIGGLTIGFSVFIVLLSMVRKELSYDEFWPNKNKLCRVALEKYYQGELQVRSAGNYRAMSDLMMQEFPEVEGRLRIGQDVITLFAGETQIQDVAMFWSDTSLFSVLGLNILDSEGSWPFADVHATVISESLALALYGTSDAVGRELEVNEGWKFYVSAVFEDIPDNSHLKADMFTEWRSLFYYLNNFDNNTGELVDNPEWTYTAPTPSMARAWNDHYVYNYILVREDADIAGLQADAEKLLETFNLPERFEDSRIYPIIQPVTDIHLKSAYPDEIRANSSIYRIYMLLLIGSIVLIISWINFINLFAIGFHEKTADMAVHLINGASKLNIQKLTLQKGLLLSLASGVLAALIINLVAKAFDPGMLFDLYTILILLALVMLTALLTMIIPMTSISTAKLMDYLKGKVFGKMKGTTYRRALVLLQFASSVVLISCTVVIYLQMEFMKKKDLGFNPEDIIYSFSPMTMNLRPDIPQKLIQFENALDGYPGVENFCVSSSIPGKPIGFPGFTVYRSVGQDERESFVNRINIHPRYFEVYEIDFLAGENYRNDHNYESSELVINRTASELMGFDQPGEAIGEFLRIGQNQFSIIGVVEDYHHLSLKSEIMPVVFFKHLWWRMGVGFYSFKLTGDELAILPQIGESWSFTYPGENFISSYLGNSYLEQYKADRAFGRSFMIAAVLAILVSCLGLLGLTKYNALKRTREIGIRKTFGASSSNILYLLQSESLILILISIVLGIPLALSIVNRWLKNFVYHIEPAWWMFLLAVAITFLVALLSISFLSIRTSRANPVDSLRYE